jgi:hypothetical protein
MGEALPIESSPTLSPSGAYPHATHLKALIHGAFFTPGAHYLIGRPTRYRAEFCPIATNLRMTGATLEQISEFLGIEYRTLSRWIRKHPELAEALKAGEAIADEMKAA